MKLVTWNTQWCCGLDGAVQPQRIVDGARALADFDVLCLQEIAQGFDGLAGAPGDQPAQLQALLPGFALFFGAAVDEFDVEGRRQRFGNLIATRLPVAQVQQHPLPWPADPSRPSMPRMCTSITVISHELGPLRIMTTHLEFHSAAQRMAQASALRALHAQACGQALAPPQAEERGSPFQPKLHTAQAILCGDFNMPASDAAYAALLDPFEPIAGAPLQRLHDAWRVAHGEAPHPPTFRLFDQRFGPDPVGCDFVFVSDTLVPRVRRIAVDTATQASDHQPVMVEFA